MKNRCVVMSAAVIAASAGLAQAQSFQEDFETTPLAGIPPTWVNHNQSSPGPGGVTWNCQNAPVFPTHGGVQQLSVNYNSGTGLSTLSNWLITPNVTLRNGDTFTFWTRTIDGPVFPDRLQVRMSTAGASTNTGATATDLGDFTTLLLDINPTYTTSGYPSTYTQFVATVSGLGGPTSGSIAFRYFVENGGPSGANSDYICIDDVSYLSANDPTGACCFPSTLSCSVTTQSLCAAGSGTYNGTGSTCAAANCPTPGACCLQDGTCSQTTSANCTTSGGIYRGNSTSCASANCPPPIMYTMNCNIPATFTDISATGTALAFGNIDDGTAAFTSSVTNGLVANPNLFVCTNGFISNSSTYAAFGNGTLPIADPSLTFGLFPDWDDFYVDAPGSVVHQALVEGGVNVEVIQWNQVALYPGGTNPRGTFEVKIFAPGGPALVQYIYQSMAWDTNGASSTVGVQWGATLAYQASMNAAGSLPDNGHCSVVRVGPACYPNCDSSTSTPCLNVLDFSCFLNAFAAGQTYANCDNSTNIPVLNVLDFSCFLNSFAAGCSSC